MQNADIKKGLESKNLLLLGFFSFFAMPQFNGLKLFHVFLGFALITVLLSNPRIMISRENSVYISILVLFCACTLIGAIRMQSGDGIFSAFLFLMYFFVVTITYQSGRIKPLLSGLYYGAIFVAIFIIADEICHYVLGFREPLISYLLPKTLLESQGHTLTNYVYIFGTFFYRPSGFAWDPGMTVPGLFLMYVINNEYKFFTKKKRIVDIIIIAAVILSISKATIIAMGAYWLLKCFVFTRKSAKKKRKWLYVLIIFAILGFLIFVGGSIEYNGYSGDQRHLKYFWSLRYFTRADIMSILFGYGFRNTGAFFNRYVPWLSSYGFYEDAVVESTITNIFLYGGGIGSLYWINYVYKIINSKNARCISILITLIILSCGNSIASCWFYLILHVLFYLSTERTEKVTT